MGNGWCAGRLYLGIWRPSRDFGCTLSKKFPKYSEIEFGGLKSPCASSLEKWQYNSDEGPGFRFETGLMNSKDALRLWASYLLDVS